MDADSHPEGVGGEWSLVVAAADCTIPCPPPESLTLEFCTSLEESSALEFVTLLTDELVVVSNEGVDVGPVQGPYASAKLVLPSLVCMALN